ncbi:hypothetical protein P167DRAFT_335930 [Morchella conica CCBAS932]|uniref:Uncharacterized protein n=1 Tax=Morchella conica CCBAS932 TaxID=1392247 RepID=A0A3N4KH33_9PEZI|nr:hypothetical protein P167DRAFT_335930 [Morchella conica CCBAS932]
MDGWMGFLFPAVIRARVSWVPCHHGGWVWPWHGMGEEADFKGNGIPAPRSHAPTYVSYPISIYHATLRQRIQNRIPTPTVTWSLQHLTISDRSTSILILLSTPPPQYSNPKPPHYSIHNDDHNLQTATHPLLSRALHSFTSPPRHQQPPHHDAAAAQGRRPQAVKVRPRQGRRQGDCVARQGTEGEEGGQDGDPRAGGGEEGCEYR